MRLKQHIRRAASGCAPLGAPSDVKEVTGEAEATHPESGEAKATHPRAASGCAPLGAPNELKKEKYALESSSFKPKIALSIYYIQNKR